MSSHILKRPIITMLIGLGLLLLMPILIILAFVSRVLSDIGFFLILFFLLLLFLTRLITASIIGKYLLERRFSFKTSNAFVSFLIAYLLLYLINLIPIIGGIITFLSIIFAIGLVFRESLQRIRTTSNQPIL